MGRALRRGRAESNVWPQDTQTPSLCPGKALTQSQPTCRGGQPCLNSECESTGKVPFSHPGSRAADDILAIRNGIVQWLQSIGARTDSIGETGPFCVCQPCAENWQKFCRKKRHEKKEDTRIADDRSTKPIVVAAASANTSVCSPTSRSPSSQHILPTGMTPSPTTGDTSECAFCAAETRLFGHILPPAPHHCDKVFPDNRQYTENGKWTPRALKVNYRWKHGWNEFTAKHDLQSLDSQINVMATGP